jgi:hypothetical protein
LDLRRNFFGYWNLELKVGPHIVLGPQQMHMTMLTPANNAGLSGSHLGFGCTYAFRRSTWERTRFQHQNFDEDGAFARTVATWGKCVGSLDTDGMFLRLIHRESNSISLAQYVLPPFLAERIFPEAVQHIPGLRPIS